MKEKPIAELLKGKSLADMNALRREVTAGLDKFLTVGNYLQAITYARFQREISVRIDQEIERRLALVKQQSDEEDALLFDEQASQDKQA